IQLGIARRVPGWWTRRRRRTSGGRSRGLGVAQRRGAWFGEHEGGAEAVLVQHRQRRLPARKHRGHRRAVQEAWLHPGVQGERRRSHMAELARLPERIRAAVVPIVTMTT